MIVQERRCRSAAQFLRLLHPRCKLWAPSAERWIFRGHGDAKWELVPRAARKNAWKDFLTYEFEPELADDEARGSVEVQQLRGFTKELDRLGFPLPGNAEEQIAVLDKFVLRNTYESAWIRRCTPIAALAQHHGLPTRLLDFSEDGRIAAYFAAQEPAESGVEDLCVWAVHLGPLEQLSGVARLDGSQLWLLRAPRSSNPNLHAQAGLFVAWNGGDRVVALDQVLASETGAQLYRFVLPRSQASRLLFLLESERITGATMFPNPDGVVAHMKERTKRFVSSLVLEDEGAQES